MAIDPMLYKKLSGRSGDPMDAYGESLAQTARRDSERNTKPDPSYSGGVSNVRKWRYIVGIVGSLGLFGALLWGFFLRK